MHYTFNHKRRTIRDDLRLVVQDRGNRYDLHVVGRLGPVGGVDDTLTSLDPTTPFARAAAGWIEQQTGMPRWRVLSELGRVWVGQLAREEVAA